MRTIPIHTIADNVMIQSRLNSHITTGNRIKMQDRNAPSSQNNFDSEFDLS